MSCCGSLARCWASSTACRAPRPCCRPTMTQAVRPSGQGHTSPPSPSLGLPPSPPSTTVHSDQPPVQPASWLLLDQRGPCPGAVETLGPWAVVFQHSLVQRGDNAEGGETQALPKELPVRQGSGRETCDHRHSPALRDTPRGGTKTSNQKVRCLTPGASCSMHGVPCVPQAL